MKFLKRHKGYASASASTESPKERYGLFDLYPKPPNVDIDIDIVAVHGLGGHFEETWTANDSKKLWLRDFLPSQLQDVGIAARLMSYGYDSTTAFSKSVTDIEDQATMLLDRLALERQSELEKRRPLIFIAHSLGGIIVKKAMIIAHERSLHYGLVLSSVQALVFFGVPHRGSDLAYWASLAARLLKTVQLGSGTNPSFVEALQRNSQTFADISQSFIERAAPLKIRTFYETEKLYGNLIVDKDSARLGLSNELPVGVTGADHSTICKFNNQDSQKYRPVWKAIQTLCVKTEEVTASIKRQPESFFIVPFPRDPLFLGRKDVIDLVDTKFESERRVALTGIGGVGKSQIAIEYCYRFRDQHPESNIFWVHAGTKERFQQAFKAIARQCKLPGWDNPAMNALDIVCDWLSSDNTWLMILDNADDKDVFFNHRPTATSQSPDSQPSTIPLVTYLPQTSRGGLILITSRNRDAAFRLTNKATNLVDVPYMSKEDAVALLCKKLPDDRSSDDERSELVELLEYLPLAITQAASYISVKRTRMTVARYSHFLKDRGDILLDDMGDLRRDRDIPSSVLLAWHISFDQINGENRPAANLLSLMSVFDRQGIPRYLLQDKNEHELDFERRLGPLEEFSLIAFEDGGESFQMHRLVQIAIRSWLEQHREIDHWKQNAAELLEKNLPAPNYQSWKTCESLLPHSEVVLGYVLPSLASQLLHADIFYWTAQYLRERGRYDTAKERCQRALNIRIDLLGEDNVKVAGALALLALIKRRTGYDRRFKTNEIEAMSRRALDIFERVRGKENIDSMNTRNNLALTLLETSHDKKIEEATEIFQSILASQEQSIGLEDPRTLVTMNNLALALQYRQKYNEAETLSRKTLAIHLRVHGKDNPNTLFCIQNLADCLVYQERCEEAQELAQRAVDLRVPVLGEEHPDTLDSMQSLSHIFYRRGKTREAEELCRHALALCKSTLGEGSEKTMQCTAMLRKKQHRYSEAEELCRHLVDTRSTVSGPDHLGTRVDMAYLAYLLSCQAKYEQAEELYREVYNRGPESWSDSDWDRFLADFADTLAELGKLEEAEGLVRQLLNTHTTRLGLEHSETRTDMANLAYLLRCQAKYEQAEELYREVYSRRPESWSDSDWDRFLADFVDTLMKLRKFEEAEGLVRQLLDAHTTRLGLDDSETRSDMANLASLLRCQAKYEQAEELYREVYSRRPESWNNNDWDEFLVDFADTLIELGEFEEAEELYREVYNRGPESWSDSSWDRFLADFADTLSKQGKHDEATEISHQRVRLEDAGSEMSET